MNNLKKLSIERITKFKKFKAKNQEEMFCLMFNLLAKNVSFTSIPKDQGRHISMSPGNLYHDFESRNMLSGLRAFETMDQVLAGTIEHIQLYTRSRINKFIPSLPLIQTLANIQLDVPCKDLPSDLACYFELDGKIKDADGHNILWAIANVREDVGVVRSLHITIFTSDLAPRHLHLPLYDDETFSQRYNKLTTRNYAAGVLTSEAANMSFEDSVDIRTILNLLIYVSNPNEEFVEQFNQFSPSNKVAQQQRQEYTSDAYVLIGEDVKFLRLCTIDKTIVKGHWRNQPCGEGRASRRWIFIGAHDRHYKTIHNE